MKVNSSVKINHQAIKQLAQAQITALEMTAEALHTEVVQARVVPFGDTGHLQNENMFVDYSNSNKGKVSIVHATPYARRMYFHPEYDFRTEPNPNAQGRWFDDWVEGKKADFCIKTYKEFYKRLGGV